MNSRLNMLLREKHGFAYNVDSNYTAYSDTGVFTIYFGSDKENIEKINSLIFKELQNLRTKKLGSLQLHKAKKQLEGQIAISSESKATMMFTIGKSFLFYDKVDDLKTLYTRINQISSENLLEVANEIFERDKLSILIYK